MRVHYRVEQLDGLVEVDAGTVEFESIDACPVCERRDPIALSVLESSLVTAPAPAAGEWLAGASRRESSVMACRGTS